MDLIQKTRDDYNKIAAHFAGTRQQAGELEKFKPFIEDGQSILDWGCGNGRLLYLLAGYGVNYFGVDQSQALLKIARQQQGKSVKKGTARFFCTAHKEKKFPPAFFDLVFLVASLHHLPDVKTRKALMKKIYSEMKDGARLIVTVWNLDSNWAKEKFKKEWKKMTDNNFLIPWRSPEGKTIVERYYHHFTQDELRELLESVGFKIEEIYYSKGNERINRQDARNLVIIARR